ncbi:EAL domain-containing protein [Enterobacteriaceae bacterium BIT-l23]|uniref:EAL domain-containing protein n=1 Tax=Jejubacter sp. L23 TaxID=3092086 RepID=UPI0015849F7D|nr:EAL domain-containing protein [Enterobacteriaceae bacterium BIT-l23]
MIRETENRCVGMPPLSVVKGMRLQSIFSLEDDRLVASEALSLLSEHTDVEGFFQRLPVSQAFALFMWQVRELIPMTGTFTVNLPLAVFCDPSKVEDIVALNVGHRIILEIQDAERLLQLSVTAQRQLIAQLSRIHQAGYRIWLDDLPPEMAGQWGFPEVGFHGVKVSVSVWQRYRMREMPLQDLVQNLRRLGGVVVIEGIETGDDLARCRRAGVDCVQGFLFPESVLTLP